MIVKIFANNLEAKLDSLIEQQKEMEFSMRDEFKSKTNEIEVSIRTIKRNMMFMNQARPTVEETAEFGDKSPLNKTGTLFDVQKKTPDDAPKDVEKDGTESEKSMNAESNIPKISNFNQPNISGQGLELIWDEIDKLRNKFDDYVHWDDFDDMGNVVDELQSKVAQITKQGGFKIEFIDGADEYTQSEDASPIVQKSDNGSIIGDDDNNELIYQDNMVKSIKKSISLINDRTSVDDILKDKQNSPSNLSPEKREMHSNRQSSKQKSKDLSPSKKSYFNPISKRSTKGTSKTIAEVRKIVEKWPKIEEAIQELRESEKVRF